MSLKKKDFIEHKILINTLSKIITGYIYQFLIFHIQLYVTQTHNFEVSVKM
jgi:hypothetical protein